MTVVCYKWLVNMSTLLNSVIDLIYMVCIKAPKSCWQWWYDMICGIYTETLVCNIHEHTGKFNDSAMPLWQLWFIRLYAPYSLLLYNNVALNTNRRMIWVQCSVGWINLKPTTLVGWFPFPYRCGKRVGFIGNFGVIKLWGIIAYTQLDTL